VIDDGIDRDIGKVKQDEWRESYHPAWGRNMKERGARNVKEREAWVFKEMGPAVRILMS
jgi:hypothetical protein